MAWTSQTLASAFSKDAIELTVQDATGLPPVGVSGLQNWKARIDGEWMLIDGQPAPKVVRVKRRGDNGTTAVAHDALSSIVFSGSPLDQVALAPGQRRRSSERRCGPSKRISTTSRGSRGRPARASG